jgi:ketosteroid isomerase-like protein
MPQANADVVRAMYAAFSELAEGADVETYVSTYFDPACEYHPVEEDEPIRGHDELIGWNRRWFDAWDALRAHAAELTEVEGAVIARVEVEGRGSASGTPVAQSFFHVIELRDGRIGRMREYLDEREALAAARA